MLRPLQFDIKPVILDAIAYIFIKKFNWLGKVWKNADFRDESITYCRKCIDLENFKYSKPSRLDWSIQGRN